MKYLLLFLLVMGCNPHSPMIPKEKKEVVKLQVEIQEPDIPKKVFEDVDDCAQQFVKMQRQCTKVAIPQDQRPEDEFDVISQCLWALNSAYGNKFPLDKDTRYDFFFRCLKEYPGTNDQICKYKLNECNGYLRDMTKSEEQARDKCHTLCEELPLYQRSKIEAEYGSCGSYCW